jgi:hypothetical protein
VERQLSGTKHSLEIQKQPANNAIWRALLLGCLALLALLMISVPFLTSGQGLWLGIDWIDGRKLFSIDDAYRYFVAKNALWMPSVLLWNYVMPVALLFDVTLAGVSSGSLLAMRLCHAALGILTLAVIARASLRSGCHPLLTLASLLIVGLMPLYIILSSSFYGEGLFAFLLALCFLLLIEGKGTLLALVAGLLPLVRPEGGIYSLLFLIYFGSRRDVKRCTLVAAPGLIYLALLVLGLGEWSSSLSWRLELRKILSPAISGQPEQQLTLDRLLSPWWSCLAMTALLIGRYRKWWPILLGPWVFILIQALAIARGVQDYELRYLFSVIPIFGVAWAFPIQHLCYANAKTPLRPRGIALLAAMVFIASVLGHLLQSDWIRQCRYQPEHSWGAVARGPDVGPEPGDRVLWFDPKPLRAFAARVDTYLVDHKDIRTVFISNSAVLYFVDFLKDDPGISVVFVPHNASVAMYSAGYFFGFDLEELAHHYYKFHPVDVAQPSPALLIIKGSGRSPFAHLDVPKTAGKADAVLRQRERVVARLQSGSIKAYAVTYTSKGSAQWTFPSPASPSQ